MPCGAGCLPSHLRGKPWSLGRHLCICPISRCIPLFSRAASVPSPQIYAMLKVISSVLVLALGAACSQPGTPIPNTDASTDGARTDSAAPDSDAPDSGASDTPLDRLCTQYSDVRVRSCGQEFASGYCGLGAFIASTPCEDEVTALFQCGINAPGSALCQESSPCAQSQQNAFLCLRAHCDVDPYQAGCISLYGCPPDCTGRVCGDDDRCGGVCTFCTEGRCNESTRMCVNDGGGANHGATCDCGNFSVVAPEPATTCTNVCRGGTTCLEQLLANTGRCAFLCDSRDAGRRGSCPSGWTCFETLFEDAATGNPIAECVEN